MYRFNIGLILCGQLVIVVCESDYMPEWSFVSGIAKDTYNAGFQMGLGPFEVIDRVIGNIKTRTGVNAYVSNFDLPCNVIYG